MSNSSHGSKTFDHTADVGLEIWGESFNAIFEEAGRALFGLIVDLPTVSPKESFTIELSAENGEELFITWLKELVYFFDTKKILLSHFQIIDLGPSNLKAKVSGEKINSKHLLQKEVKAITRHQFEFKKTKEGFRAKVIVDI